MPTTDPPRASHAGHILTIMLVALSMALAFSHLLQMAPRLSLDGPTWITTQQLFALYGSVGGPLEIGAVLATAVLAYRLRGRHASGWAVLAALGTTTALVIWLLLVAPANAEIRQWIETSMAVDWERWRTQWEYAHATRAVLLIVALGASVQAALTDVQERGPDGPRTVGA